MKPLISDTLKESLYGQLAEEKRNGNIYLSIASYLNGKGLSNLAKLFLDQHAEETEHSLIIYSLLSDLSIVFVVPEIPFFDLGGELSIQEVANLYLEREFLTTESLDEIKRQAMDESNPVIEERMRDMIEIQQKEYAEATDFLDKSYLFTEWWQVGLWDVSLGKGG